MQTQQKLTLVKTCRATGVVGKFTGAHPHYHQQHDDLGSVLGWSPDRVRMALLMTLDPKAPPVATPGFLYRYEA